MLSLEHSAASVSGDMHGLSMATTMISPGKSRSAIAPGLELVPVKVLLTLKALYL